MTPASRQRRYAQHLRRTDPGGLAAARLGPARYSEYQQVVAPTLPIDHR